MKRTKTFTVTFNWFAPGTIVTPTSTRCPLESGKFYVVTECHEPSFPDENAVVFVQGKQIGLSTEYLREAEAYEIV